MENLAIYLLKSSALIAVFFVAYHFLLRKETFFKSNRWFLLFGLLTSVVLPLLTFTKVVWVATNENFSWANVPVDTEKVEMFKIDWIIVLAVVYGIGLILFMLKFVFDLTNLSKILKGKIITRQSHLKLVDIAENVAPFSFFNYIVYNPSLYSQSELDNILEHEKVHCEQYHSADVLIARFICIFFWYNPFVWLYKKAMLQNLEFIADNEALKNISDKKAYQITLLKVTAHVHCVEITNHFYQSLIKKRIVMLNKNQSQPWNSWKYALIIPALAAFMFYFQVEVIAQEKERNPIIVEKIAKESISVVIDKNTSDEQMKRQAAMLKKEHGIALKFSKVKRNKVGEIIAIKAVYKDKDGNSGSSQISGGEPIKPLRFYKNDDGQFGFGTGTGRDVRTRIVRHSDGDEEIEIAELPKAHEAPEPPEMPEGSNADAPQPPQSPILHIDGRKVKVPKSPNGITTVTVDGEVVTVDVDKILADLEPMLAELENMDIDVDTDEIDRMTKDAMKEARIAIKMSYKDMKRSLSDVRRQQIARVQSIVDMEQSRIDIEKARKELDESKRELEKSRTEIAKLRAESKKK